MNLEETPPSNAGEIADAADKSADKSASKNILKHLASFAISGVLLYFAFNKVDPAEIWRYTQEMNPWPLAIVVVTALASHVLRAYRWTILLKPFAGRQINLVNSFYAVILGYAINVAIPRGGEVARLLSICKDEKLAWPGVLSTLLVDRMLDMALLVFLLGTCLVFLPQSFLETFPALLKGGIGLLIATIIGLLLLPYAGSILRFLLKQNFIACKLPKSVLDKLTEMAEQFDSGTRALKDPVGYPLIAALSFVIWGLYWCNFYFMLPAFHLEKIIGPVDTLIIFTIGSVGVLIPTPGNAGSFHYLVCQSMELVAPQVSKAQALAYATILHVLTFVLTNCITAALLFLFRKSSKK